MTYLTRRQAGAAGLRWLALFLIPFLALAVVHAGWDPMTTAGDYAQYLLHTRALLEGRPYGDIGYIYHPAAGLIGPATLPPGLPLTLAPIVAVGGVHSPLVRLLMVVSVIAFAALATWRLAPEVAPWQAAFGAGCAAFAIEVSLGTVAPISDPGFAALIWGTILAVDRDGRWTWHRVAGVTALGLGTISYRAAGIALIPGLLLYALLQRRRLGALPFVPAALWLAAGAVALMLGFTHIPFSERMLGALSAVSNHLRTFYVQYHVAPLEAILYPFRSNGANDVYHAVAALPALLGLILLCWRARRSFMVAGGAAYCVLLLVAPVAEPRYAWPLYPIVAASLAHGVSVAIGRVARGWSPRRVAWAAGIPLALMLVVALATYARQPAPGAFVRHADARALFTWLSQRQAAAAPDAPLRVAFFNPRVLTLETGVAAMGLVLRTAPGMLTSFRTARVSHVIAQNAGLGERRDLGAVPCVQRIANTLPDLYPASFTLEYLNPTFRVYRFHPGTGGSDSDGERISWSDC